MNKKFYGTLLLGTLLLGSTIVSCKDYDDDIDNLQNQITQLATKADMQSEVSKLQSAVATAQAAAENKAAAAEQAAKDAAAKAQAAADAAAAAQGKADAAATVEALNQVAAEAAAAAKAAEEAKVAAEAKAEELASQLAELQALAATLVSTEDFEAAKKELNDKYAELAAKIGETTGVTGMTGINLIDAADIKAGYGVWAGVHKNMAAAEWDGPKAETINAIEKGTKLAAWGAEKIKFSVNPTDFDASKIESFAVVNQFDEVAPIAFGAPKAVTRAAAGAWTLPILGNVIYGEKAVEFQKNYNQDGTVATLAAGQFAGALKTGFCSVAKNENTSTSTGFIATVAYDEINGVVELIANDATKVLDAYITTINTGLSGDATKNAHDSVVYKLAYTGTTLTYDAAAVKKFLDDNAGNDKTIVLNMKEINLNGYIHTSTGTVTFSKKEAAKPVVLERIQLDATPHTIVPLVWNKSEGKDDDNQKVTVSILPALQKWGIDLSKTKEEATIHWNHTTFATEDVKVIADSVYYLKDDQTPVYLKKFVETASLSGEAKDKKQNADLTLQFYDNYTYTNVEKDANDKDVDNFKDGVDAAFNGKLIYIPVKMTGTDSDNGVDKTVEYSVVVPVQFNKINISDYYQWNKGKAIKIAKSTMSVFTGTLDVNIAKFFEATATTGDATTGIITLDAPSFTKMNTEHKDMSTATPAGTLAYIMPSATVSGQFSGNAYTKALADMQKAGYDDPKDKTKMEAELKNVYTHAVSLVSNSSTTNVYIRQGYLNVKQTGDTSDKYKWVVTKEDDRSKLSTTMPTSGSPVELYMNIQAPTAATTTYVDTYVDSKYTDLLYDAKYTVNGLTATIMGRSNVALGGLEVEVYDNAAAATATITTEAKLNASGATLLYNALFPAANAENFDGSFSLKDANGKTIDLTSVGSASVKKINADGTIGTTVTGVSLGTETYTIDDKGTTKVGLKITISTPTLTPDTDVASGDKIAIQFTYNGKIAGTSTISSAPVTLKVEIK